MIMEIKMNNSLTFDEVADKLGCSVEDLQKIAFKKILFSFGSMESLRTFAVLQLTIKYANGIFYARKETYILKYRQTISVYHRPMAMVGCSKLGYLSAFLFNNK